MAVINLLSGFLIPLAFFPTALRLVAEALPFRAIIMIPNEIYLGRIDPALGLLFQCFWIVTMIAGARWVLGKGKRKVVVQGG